MVQSNVHTGKKFRLIQSWELLLASHAEQMPFLRQIAFQIIRDVLLCRLDAFEIKLNIFHIKASVSQIIQMTLKHC